MRRQMTVAALCEALCLPWQGENVEIQSLYLEGRQTAYNAVLSYAATGKWIKPLLEAGAVKAIVARQRDQLELDESARQSKTWIFSDTPEKTFYDIHDFLYDHTDFYEKFQAPPLVGKDCQIHPTVVLEQGVQIGERVCIGPFAVIQSGSSIGDDTTIGSGTVIGEDGFQVLRCDGKNRKIRHCGRVLIGSDVSIGSQNVVHRSLFEGATTIGAGAKLDALIYVAHNCHIAENAVITSGVMLCGSTVVGPNAWIGPNASILNRIAVGRDGMVGMGSVVTRSVPPDTLFYGVPARERTPKGTCK